jgi:hypothetical protein
MRFYVRPLILSWLGRLSSCALLLLACAGPLERGASCNDTDSTISCCLKENPGQFERCGAEPRPHMMGERGARIDSKTLWRGERGARLDVENPAPGRRPGQIHLQVDGEKYLYDPETTSFRGAPRAVQELLEDPRVQDAIQKALRYLGEA